MSGRVERGGKGHCTTLRAPPGNIQLGCLSLSLSRVGGVVTSEDSSVQFSHDDEVLPSLRLQSGISTGRTMSETNGAVILVLVLLGNLGICVEWN